MKKNKLLFLLLIASYHTAFTKGIGNSMKKTFTPKDKTWQLGKYQYDAIKAMQKSIKQCMGDINPLVDAIESDIDTFNNVYMPKIDNARKELKQISSQNAAAKIKQNIKNFNFPKIYETVEGYVNTMNSVSSTTTHALTLFNNTMTLQTSLFDHLATVLHNLHKIIPSSQGKNNEIAELGKNLRDVSHLLDTNYEVFVNKFTSIIDTVNEEEQKLLQNILSYYQRFIFFKKNLVAKSAQSLPKIALQKIKV